MPNIKVKYIIDENGDRVAPVTHIDAVRDSSGNGLSDLMVPENLGFGIGTCSTSSGTALTVALLGYKLVKNGYVTITFENDVPASSTLNINSQGAKPIIYKGSAIEANTIKADDTVMFAYDGTNYVVTSLGGGGSEVQVNEVAVISLVSDDVEYQNSLIGATIVITDDDTSETLLSTTWQGTPIELEIAVPTDYTITVGAVTNFLTPTPQSFSSKTTRTRNITFEYEFIVNAVNLGLPSGTKWASGNIVSDGNGGYEIGIETAYGAFVSWGNVIPHFSSNGSTFDDGYDWGTANTGPYASTPGAAISGSQTTGASYAANSGYDAARQLLGGKWRMPTAAECKELNDNCTSVWTTKNGVAGREFTSNINGAKIFFPAAGYGHGTSLFDRGSSGCYWSSSLNSADSGYYLCFDSGGVYPQLYYNRYVGFTVRAVL